MPHYFVYIFIDTLYRKFIILLSQYSASPHNIYKQYNMLGAAQGPWNGVRVYNQPVVNGLSEGQRTVAGIIAANAVVFCCWRVPALYDQILHIQPCLQNPVFPHAPVHVQPLLLLPHGGQHVRPLELLLQHRLHARQGAVHGRLHVCRYQRTCVISTMFSYVCKTASGRLGPSLGASGAIMTVLAAVCTKMPEAKLAIIFLPIYAFSAGNALKAIVVMDTAGLVLGWQYFDHVAHLGGALFGVTVSICLG
ncbi:unnamed protein product [Oncorhynchus mykiss]|uniref:rhomboid protease n=1 Tax=Oncorhynchus mykiss TaxID=8022 RepID=A0A060W5E5_ONCMY|nr:unnamed protein product [Oncorhynchus mykiss]